MLFFPPALVASVSDTKEFQAKCAAYTQAKDWKGLETYARTYAEAHPKDAPSRAALGYALFLQNRSEDGRAACQESIKLDSRYVEAYLYLGMNHAIEKDRAGVLSWGQKLEQAVPRASSLYFRAPVIFCAVGKDPAIPCAELKALKVLSQPKRPPYPPFAKEAGIEGTLLMDVTIGPDGVPTEAVPLSGPPQLRQYANQYLLQWRFQPFLVDGHASVVRTGVPLVMKIED